jgi:prepilin peptidase CpaA
MVNVGPLVLIIVSVALLIVAVLYDLAVRMIPNYIPLGLLTIGVILRLLQGEMLSGVGISALLAVGTLILWFTGVLGGGDMKLIPTAALTLPPDSILHFVTYVALAGGVLACIYLVLSLVVQRPDPGLRAGLLPRVFKAEAWRVSRRGPLPYAVAIASGAFPILIAPLVR